MSETSYQAYVGRSEDAEDTVGLRLVRGLAAALDIVPPERDLPPLWHWMLFQNWVPAAQIGPDGHPRRGGFLPPVHDLPRRMWAGGRLDFLADIPIGARLHRRSTILAIRETSGGSGSLVFITLRHEIATEAGPAIVEEQDIVYRGTAGAAVKPAAAAPEAPAGAFGRTLTPDPVLLFRYSALTGNGHRIHYDLDYVTRVEGYPGLIVHGPLQATLLADLLRREMPDRRVVRFSFRGQRPAFAGAALRLLGHREGTKIRLESRDPAAAVCMSAEAALA